MLFCTGASGVEDNITPEELKRDMLGEDILK
jgi:hypothetical protein